MSRYTDIAAVLSVLSTVLTKSATLRRVANENKWKTSSIMRQVGLERQSNSYDNFYTSEDGTEAPAADRSPDIHNVSSQAHTLGKDEPASSSFHTEPNQSVKFDSHQVSAPTPDAVAREGVPTGREDHFNQDETEADIFFLRQARSIPRLSSKTAKDDPRKGRTFRSDKDSLRPTQADRFDVRSTLTALKSRNEPPIWKPQIAIDTKLSDTEPIMNDLTDKKHEDEKIKSSTKLNTYEHEATVEGQSSSQEQITAETNSEQSTPSKLSSSAVPSSRFSRLYHYTTLGASLGYNVFADSTKRLFNGPTEGAPVGFLSSKNTDLLVKKLSRMRGAALKLGQMISFQDENLPGPIREVLQRVQDSADYMPAYQLDKVLSTEFGVDWRNMFAEFDDIPIAAASIGQVHTAKLPDGRKVAVKVQYPGVASSISSDLRNLSLLLTASRLLPKGLYLDKTIENARTELGWECDYIREAENTRRFRELVGFNEAFKIPEVIDECSGKQVLTTEFLEGRGIAKSQSYSQELRNFLGSELMRLCLRELAEFRFMQTDPNWTNFLYNTKTKQIELLDFGACRSFDESFIRKYCELLVAGANGNRAELKRLSTDLGYLTGNESSAMVNAHISSILTLSEPFAFSNPSDTYDFENQTVTDRVKSFIPVMLRERLAPPPEETYSLHRRLSGHFLLCARLRSRVDCKSIFRDVMTQAGYIRPSI